MIRYFDTNLALNGGAEVDLIKQYRDFAEDLECLNQNPERSVAIRHLLDSMTAALRAMRTPEKQYRKTEGSDD